MNKTNTLEYYNRATSKLLKAGVQKYPRLIGTLISQPVNDYCI